MMRKIDMHIVTSSLWVKEGKERSLDRMSG